MVSGNLNIRDAFLSLFASLRAAAVVAADFGKIGPPYNVELGGGLVKGDDICRFAKS